MYRAVAPKYIQNMDRLYLSRLMVPSFNNTIILLKLLSEFVSEIVTL